MKEAFVGVGIIVLFTFGFLAMNLFGNIAVTDQLNYTTMKNSVEAAMYDSVDLVHYRSGFCLCTIGNNFAFKSSNDYEVLDLVNGGCEPSDLKYHGVCKLQLGEYKIDKEIFAESFVRRFAEMVNNNKNYRLFVDKVIEYPPKASVRVESDDNFGMGYDDSGYSIVNAVDGILEEIDVKEGE